MKLIANEPEQAVREELWVSFRSLLQAYLAAAQVGEEVPQAALAELSSSELQVIGPHHTVRLEWQAASGEGYWAVFRTPEPGGKGFEERHLETAGMLDEGAFRLHLDAEFEWSGKPGRLGMDAVAEALATQVTE